MFTPGCIGVVVLGGVDRDADSVNSMRCNRLSIGAMLLVALALLAGLAVLGSAGSQSRTARVGLPAASVPL